LEFFDFRGGVAMTFRRDLRDYESCDIKPRGIDTLVRDQQIRRRAAYGYSSTLD
jgi:hypothetical protein